MKLQDKKSLSAVVTTLILVALSLAAVAIVWGFVSNTIDEELESAESCVDILGKVQINPRYTCHNASSNELEFSISVGEIDVDKILISISGSGKSSSFELGKTGATVPGARNFTDGGSIVSAPKQNSGLTYVYDMDTGGFTGVDEIEIVPVVGGKQCSASDSLAEIPTCVP